MRYGDLISRSMAIFWRHRYLWLLGVLGGGEAFGAGPGGGGGGGGNYSIGQSAGGAQGISGQFSRWLGGAAPLLITLGVVLGVVLIVYFFVSCVATGALVRGAAEHDAERPFQFRAAWRSGTRTFTSILGLRLLVLLAALVVAAVFGGLVLVAVLSATSGSPAGVVVAVVTGVPLLLALIPAAVIASITVTLATRAIVLEQRGVFDALARGWRLLFGQRIGRVLLVWLLSLALGIGIGIVNLFAVTVIGLPLAAIAGLAYAAGGLHAVLTAGAVLLFVLVLALVAIGGATGSYLSIYWTLAFRRLELDAIPAT